MATTTLADLATGLQKKSQVQQSEGFIFPEDFEEQIQEALILHNSAYVATEDSCTVPLKEKAAVELLAWSQFCLIRASKLASSSSGSNSSGFGSDRNSPYYKLMDLSKKLQERYTEICKALNLTSFYGSGGSVVASEVIVESYDLGAQVPLEMTNAPAPVVLSSTPSTTVADDGSVILEWECTENRNFYQYLLFHIVGSSAIYQSWNYSSESGIPRINDNADLLETITRGVQKSVKVTGLTVDSGTVNRFLIVVVSKSGKHTYSNELVLTQA